jgi:hypothetical protein
MWWKACKFKSKHKSQAIPTCPDLWSQVHSCKLWSSYIDYWYVYVNNLQCEHLFTNLLSYIGCVVSWFFKFPVFVSHCIRIVLYIWASSYITKAKLFTFFSLLSHHHCFSNCILNSIVQSFDIFGSWNNVYNFLKCRLSPGIEELIQKLKANHKHVYLISGGFRQMINVWRIVVIIIFSDLFQTKKRISVVSYRLLWIWIDFL